jgi:ribosomal protein L37E
MPRDDSWTDSEWDDDDSGDADYGPDDQSTTTECRKCGCEIFDDSPRCPLCGEYQVGEHIGSAWEGRPFWWKLGGLLGILAVLFALLSVWF